MSPKIYIMQQQCSGLLENMENLFISQLEIAISVFTSAKMKCTKGENDTELNLNGPNTAGVKTP